MHTIYMHNTRRNGQTDVTEHHVWDGDLFLSRATDRARVADSKSGDAADPGDVVRVRIATEQEYRNARQ